MQFLDLVKLVYQNLGRRKGRVALTAVGVVIGTSAVVVLVSLAIGLQRNAQEQLLGIGDLSLISVSPVYGDNPVAAGGMGIKGQPQLQTIITDQSLQDFAALPGVAAVFPRDWLQAGMMMRFGRMEGYAGVIGASPHDLEQMGLQPQSGTIELGRGKVIIGSAVAKNFYDPKLRPGQEPPSPPELQDQVIQMVFTRWAQDGTEVRKTVPTQVVGILQETRGEPDWSIYMDRDEMNAINEWFLGRRINRNQEGYNMAIVKAAEVDQVLTIADQINQMGYQASTAQSYVEGINSFYLVLQVIFGGVGAIALLVAAIGIANTMAMSILERTREIGLMKAIGATNRDVLSIFLGEAAGIGLIGGLGGILLGWSTGQVINVLALAYLAGQAAQTGGSLPTVAVYTPNWLPLFALMFSVFIGLISGLYPALRAATMLPVTALKYE